MPETPIDFLPRRDAFRRQQRSRRPPPLLGNKLQEIGMLSPADLDAFEVLADAVLARLHEQQTKHA